MKQKLRYVQRKLGTFYLPILLALFVVISVLISWTSIRPKQYSFQLNEVAQETIRATRTVEDTEQTKINKQVASDSVVDIYHYDSEIVNQQLDYITNFFSAIRVVAGKSSADIGMALGKVSSDDSTTSKNYVATMEDRVQFFRKSLDETNKNIKDYAVFIPDWAISAVLSANDTQLTNYETVLHQIVQEEMSTSIKESNLTEVTEEADKRLFYYNFTDKERELLEELLNNAIISNNVLDTQATERAKEAAADAVNPVKILQGQVIVQKGQVINTTDIKQLELLGMMNSTPSYHVLLGYIALLAIVVIVLAKNYYRELKKCTTEDQKETVATQTTAFVFFFIISLIGLVVIQLIQARGTDEVGLLFPVGAITYLVYRATHKMRYALGTLTFLPIFALFIYQTESNLLQVIIVFSFYLLVGMIGFVLALQADKRELSMKHFLSVVIIHVLAISPLVLYSNYEIYSKPVVLMLIFSVINAIETVLIPVIVEPYVEYLFEDSSVLLLTELSNPNQELLKQLITIAPGTYHHSLMVANISANCVEAVGGDSLLARVASYYHDIGKIEHPLFFIENLPAGMESPHKLLTPYESKEIIFGHVTKGVKILEQHGLPQPIIDVCAQHHGTTLMKYFYAEALKSDPDAKEEDFRYPGPKPQTKEAAIINLVDSAEAATRAMKEPTLEKVEKLVHGLVMSRVEDEQYIECNLTIQELKIVEKNIVTSLNGTFHSRIEYPTINKKGSK
ncbi:hypothetical protein SAMN05421767_10156 [Granulicatella balaenopterae]|uniref:HD/PDEase domain-containing protein n=1 Tax=Granulicatella balaenopterae TaxID=137733 RepID=A0A1H9GV60_9LACT|nr:HDIG domain-containing metalloprotein [Granulicatella balaenopterae]SEQ53873.1 hypothetical protein SAMN05421767_10156 [Granulicatella balaenopterae]